MKFHSGKFYFSKDGIARQLFSDDFLNTYPRFNKHGERITNPFTHKVIEVLERVLWELSAKEFAPGPNVQIHVSIAQDEHDYWVEAEVDTKAQELKHEIAKAVT